MSHRRPLAILIALVILAVPGTVALAAGPGQTSESPAPLLWAGRVVDRQGQPVPAQVTAFLRPPASAIPTIGEGKAAPASIPLTSTQAGRDGRFELRAEAPTIPAEYRPDGWLNVMLLTEGADGSWSIATDSVRYVARRGRPDETGVAVHARRGRAGRAAAVLGWLPRAGHGRHGPPRKGGPDGRA